MNKIEMHLHPEHIDLIKNSGKRIELRLYDKKRQAIEIGDQIKFIGRAGGEVETEVIGLLRYRTFEDLISDLPIELLSGGAMTKPELLKELERFYSLEDQLKNGVLGIRIKLI